MVTSVEAAFRSLGGRVSDFRAGHKIVVALLFARFVHTSGSVYVLDYVHRLAIDVIADVVPRHDALRIGISVGIVKRCPNRLGLARLRVLLYAPYSAVRPIRPINRLPVDRDVVRLLVSSVYEQLPIRAVQIAPLDFVINTLLVVYPVQLRRPVIDRHSQRLVQIYAYHGSVLATVQIAALYARIRRVAVRPI